MSALTQNDKDALQIIRLATEQAERVRHLEMVVANCADIADRYSYEAAQAIRRAAHNNT